MTLELNATSETTVDDALPQPAAQPSPPPIRVVLAMDGSKSSEEAEQFLSILPLPEGSEIRVVTVMNDRMDQLPLPLKLAEQDWSRRLLECSVQRLAREGVRASHFLARGDAAHEILRAADVFDAELIVVGAHGRTGLDRLRLGSVARNVAKHSRRPVLLVRNPGTRLGCAVLAVDDSPSAADALRFTARLPLPEETGLVMCHVSPRLAPPFTPVYVPRMDSLGEDFDREYRERGEQLLSDRRSELTATARPVTTVLRTGDPATEILALAKEADAGLVIAGARGGSAIRALIVGSVAERLIQMSECAVLIVH